MIICFSLRCYIQTFIHLFQPLASVSLCLLAAVGRRMVRHPQHHGSFYFYNYLHYVVFISRSTSVLSSAPPCFPAALSNDSGSRYSNVSSHCHRILTANLTRLAIGRPSPIDGGSFSTVEHRLAMSQSRGTGYLCRRRRCCSCRCRSRIVTIASLSTVGTIRAGCSGRGRFERVVILFFEQLGSIGR